MKFLIPVLFLTSGTPTVPDHADAGIVFGPPVRQASWEHPPDIVVCHDAPIREKRVKDAVAFWKDLGYEIGTITVANRDDFSCARDLVLYGEIVVKLVGQDFEIGHHLATTKTWFVTETKKIFKAEIQIMNGWGDSERLMEHEIGHALGWRDYNQTGHIMNTDWSRGGWHTKGLRQ